MDVSQKKEQFSRAYVRAVAAVTGLRVSEPEVDDDSIDMTLAGRGGGGPIRSPKLDLQLKCTATWVFRKKLLGFSLGRKNYDDLRDPNVMVPRLLVVVTVPKQLGEWLLHKEENLSLYHCAYWLSLRGMPENLDQDSVTVHLLRDHWFNVPGVTAIMGRIAAGGLP
jgi:hypothetical protein